MRENQNADSGMDWEQRWQEGRTGWDLGMAHPLMPFLLERARREGGLANTASVFVPGCGRAHEAAFMAQLGYQAFGLDVSPTAIEQATAQYGHLENLRLFQADILSDPSHDYNLSISNVSAIVDRAMLCALPPAQRCRYLEFCTRWLPPGGLFMGILFAEVNLMADAGPPFALDEQQLSDLFKDNFSLVCLERHRAQAPAAIKQEWLCIWSKNDNEEC